MKKEKSVTKTTLKVIKYFALFSVFILGENTWHLLYWNIKQSTKCWNPNLISQNIS